MNEMQPKNPRKSPRAEWIDYDDGIFFVTICTRNKQHFFGEISNGEMHLSEIGRFAEKELNNPGEHHPHIEIPLFVVMPNHIHAIVDCKEMIEPFSTDLPKNQRNPNPSQRTVPDMARHVPTLSRYITSLKSAITRYAHKSVPAFKWQKRYHDHGIRSNKDGNTIANYIETNVARWDSDCYNDK